jgi:predicted dehydrogenase
MNASKVGMVVVGLGHIGKRHAAMIAQNAETELVAVCDVDRQKGREDVSVPFFESIDAVLASGLEFDVLSIATPNGLHEAHGLKGLKAGKHVIIEKPMALTKAGCERILYEALNQRRHVFCVMQNRYSPPAIWLKDLMEKGVLGKIYFVQISCFWNRDERYYVEGGWHGTKELDGGTLFTQFSHFIDIMYWLFGDIENISGRLREFNHAALTAFEDSGSIQFDFVNGGIGSFNFSTSVWSENLESSMTIIAENGTVKIGGQYMNEVQLCRIRNYEMPVLPPGNPPNDYGLYKGSAANHHFVFENVVEVLKGRSPISTNAMEGMKIVEIIERIYRLA